MEGAYLATFGGLVLTILAATFPQYSEEQKINSPLVKVLTYNAYMVPSFVANKMPEFKTAKNQQQRMKGLAELSLSHEIIGMQEFWGSASYTYNSHVSYSHSILYKSWFGSFLIPETWNEYIEMYIGIYFQRGGLQVAVKHDISIVHKDRYIFKNNSDAEKTLHKNVVGYLLDMNSYWPGIYDVFFLFKPEGKYLLFFDVHMNSDPVNAPSPVRSAQLIEMKEFMIQFINDVKDKLGGKSIHKDVGFVLVGDFNCASTCIQYKEILNAFGKSRDLFFEQHKGIFMTVMTVPDIADSESCFTYDKSSKNSYVINELNGVEFSDPGRIDYIFAIDQLNISSENKIEFMPLEAPYCEITRQSFGQEFSDHWGVEAHVQPKNIN